MSDAAPPTPAERLAGFVRRLSEAVVTRGLFFQLIAPARADWVLGRLKTLRDRFGRLARRIALGTYRPRKPAGRRAAPMPRRGAESPIPRRRGWLGEALPEAAQYRGMLLHLLNDPQTRALAATAPAEMGRILRPLCWMLNLAPPPCLAAPKRRPRPKPEPAATRSARPGRPGHPRAPAPGGPPSLAAPGPPRAKIA
jgi:hypothetical protein